MIDKELLLEKMRVAMKSEDGLIALYTRHLENVVGYGDLDKKVKSELVTTLERLRKESAVHFAAIQELYNSIENSERNAY